MTIFEVYEKFKTSSYVFRVKDYLFGFAKDTSGNIKIWGNFNPEYLECEWEIADNSFFQEIEEMKNMLGFSNCHKILFRDSIAFEKEFHANSK